MDQSSVSTSLFDLRIDAESSNHLLETARWAKFVSIVGFILCALMVLIGLFAGSFMTAMMSQMGGEASLMGSGLSAIYAIVMILIALFYFFPCLFLYRFATKTKVALAGNDQSALNAAFRNMKSLYRFVGIILIIILSLYALIFLFAILGTLMGRR